MRTDPTTFALAVGGCGDTFGRVTVRPTATLPPEDPAITRARRTWTAGDYDRIAAGFRHEAEAFVGRLGLGPGMRVLDAACGSGNITIPAARTGAQVTGLDIAPNLLAEAAAWAHREGLTGRFDEGSVESLPYADEAFDVVLSMFGTMFAARPAQVAAELARVTRPGGKVALANWTADGFVGRMLRLHVAAVPAPAGVPSPLLWGDEEVVRERLPPSAWEVTCARRTLTFTYPCTPAGTAELFRVAYGPTVRTLEQLDEDGRVRFADALRDLWTRHADTDAAGTRVAAEYLEVVAIRR